MRHEAAPDVQIILDARAAIGEAPTWVADEHALYWIDIKEPALHRYDVASGATRRWQVPADIGAFCLFEHRAAALVALRDGLFRLDLGSGGCESVTPAPSDPLLFRFNEGACDGAGRFWVGSMFDPLDPRAPAQPASLHSFTLEGGLRPEPDAAELHNGMAWSPDGRVFYLAHTMRREIFAFDFDADEGSVRGRRLFARIDAADGLPDGAAVDIEGGYWCALHGAGRVRRYSADGRLAAEIPLPVSQPTMCAFGGERLDTLYVTSARQDLTPEQLRREPHAGAILALQPGTRGVPRRCTLRQPDLS